MGLENVHNLLIYSNLESKIKHASEFLIEGIKQNEIIILIDDEENNFKQQMEKNYRIDLRKLEKEKNAVILNSNKWYFPKDKFDSNDLLNRMYDIVKQAKDDKKTGVRVFGDKTVFFRNDPVERFFECEKILGMGFDLPITALCAYMSESIGILNPENRGILYDFHSDIIKETPRPQKQLRRNKLEIYFDILVAIGEAGENAVQTRIQGKSNLSYDKFTKYLDEMRERKLIQRDPLSITDKGREFVSKFDSISSFLHKMGLDYIQ